MGKRNFYTQWACVAFSHSIGIGDGIAFLLGCIVPILIKILPDWESAMTELAWQIPLGVFSALVLARLLLAPYWIYQRLAKENIQLQKQLKVDTLTQSASRLVSIRYKSHQFSDKQMLKIALELFVLPSAQIEAIELELQGKTLSSNWISSEVLQDLYGSFDFEIPAWISPGRHTLRLLAFANGQKYASDDFVIDFPKR